MPIDEEYFQSEEFQELLDGYEASIESGAHPFMDADDLVDIADYYSFHDDMEKAEEVINYALELYPDATLPNVFKARDALNRFDFDEADSYAQNISDKDDPDYHYLLAEILIAQNKIGEADEYLRQYGKEVAPDEYGDFVKDVANLYIDYNINDKAYEWMMRCADDQSDDFKELMARTLFGLGKYKDSERIFNELIDHNPYSKRYWNALSSAQYMNEDYSNAVTSSEYAIAIDPQDPESLLSKANGLFRLGNYEEAAKYFERYDQQGGPDGFSLLHRGVCLLNLNRRDEAVGLLEQALQVSAKEGDISCLPQIYQELAFCYSSQKQLDKALDMLNKADELPCDHTEMLIIRGHILLENDDLAGAATTFKQAILKSEGDPSVLLRIMVSLYDNRYVDACYYMLKKFLHMTEKSKEPFNEGYAYMALCCYDKGYADEFLDYLLKAVTHNPNEARVVLGFLFPPETEVSDYYDYMARKINGA